MTFSFEDTHHRQMAQGRLIITELFEAASIHLKSDGSAPHGILLNVP
jgi:hypothetical protein